MGHVFEIPPERRHRLTVEDFHRLAESGILGEDDRVELIGGELIDMTPIGSRHAAAVDHLVEALILRLQGSCQVHTQNPVRLGEDNEPQPDVAVLRRRDHGYASRLPAAEDVLLVVEVADSSLAFDRDVKLPLYARFGIPEAWLVDLEGGRIEVHSAPDGGEYGHVDRYRRGTSVASPLLGLSLDADACLAPPG